MECSRIPTPKIWDQLEPEALKKCRLHVQFCQACRARVFREAPDQLLFDLQTEPLPEDFWLGFWHSVKQKRSLVDPVLPFHPIRWAAVFLVGFLLLLYGQPLREDGGTGVSSAQISRVANPRSKHTEVTGSYPVIEYIDNPEARYYIFQSGEQEKIVMVFDPDMEL